MREEGHPIALDKAGAAVELSSMFRSVDGIMDYLEGTGLARVLREKRVLSLVDYVFGVETGLDSHARKNRGGSAMARTVERAFRSAGVAYRKEVCSREWPAIQAALGQDTKRFDLAVEARGVTSLIEVNFYGAGGSKPNETARAYAHIGREVDAVDGFRFVWVTDGVGWRSARTQLEETFRALPHVYNLTTLKDFIRELC